MDLRVIYDTNEVFHFYKNKNRNNYTYQLNNLENSKRRKSVRNKRTFKRKLS